MAGEKVTTMLTYEDTVTVGDDTTIGTLNTIEDELTAVGAIVPGTTRGRLRFRIEADDLWELRDTLAGLEQALGAYQVNFTPDKTKVTEVRDAAAVG